jgi:hypothetical protein
MNRYLAQCLSYRYEVFRNRFPSLIYIQNRPQVFFSNPGPLAWNCLKLWFRSISFHFIQTVRNTFTGRAGRPCNLTIGRYCIPQHNPWGYPSQFINWWYICPELPGPSFILAYFPGSCYFNRRYLCGLPVTRITSSRDELITFSYIKTVYSCFHFLQAGTQLLHTSQLHNFCVDR